MVAYERALCARSFEDAFLQGQNRVVIVLGQLAGKASVPTSLVTLRNAELGGNERLGRPEKGAFEDKASGEFDWLWFETEGGT